MTRFVVLIVLLLIVRASAAAESSAGDDFATVRKNVLRSMLPEDPRAVGEIVQAAQRRAKTLRDDGSWPDIDYNDQARSEWRARQHLERASLLARAYHLSPNDKQVLTDTHAALDYWLEKDFKNPNWWHNDIGTPLLIGTIDLLLGDAELTAKEKEKSLEILRRSVWTKWTGQNLVWGITNQVFRGLIENDSDRVAKAYERLYDEIRIATDEGIQPDFSFHQHGAQLYNGGYGLNFAQDVPRLVGYSWGTRWQIPPKKMDILCAYLLDGERWMMHGQRIDYSTVGREITRRGKTAAPKSWTDGAVGPTGATYALPRAIQLLSQLPIPRQAQMQNFAASLTGRQVEPLLGDRNFPYSDYIAHHRPGWFTSVKMLSTRMVNAELVNDEGTRSQHLSDGANFLYLTGDEYLDIFPVWDWNKVPGTTAEQTKSFDRAEIKAKGTKTFVGGVSDGTFGAAAHDFARGKLAARKFWAFFDDSYICLGTGISSDTDNDVATSVNQCLLDGKVSEGANWLHHANVGCIFPGGRGNVKFTAGPQEGRWSDIGTGSSDLVKKDVFTAWIDHGIRPTGASYVYEVLPAATPQQTAERAASPVVQVLWNASDLQAVYHTRRDLLAAAFWKAGRVKDVEVDGPCLVLYHDGKLAVSNPAHTAVTLHLTIGRKSIDVKVPDDGSTVVVTP